MRKDFVCICFSLGVAFLIQTMLLVAVPLAALALGATPLMLGLLVSVPYILPLFLAIPCGSLVARWGSRRALQVGAVGMVLGTGLLAGLPGFNGLIIGQLVIGLAQLLMILSAQTTITYFGKGERLEHYFGWYTTFLSVGQMLGPLAGGWIIDYQDSPSIALAASFVVAFFTLSAFFMGSGGSRGELPVVQHPSQPGYMAQLDLLKNTPGVQLSVVVSVAAMLALGAHGSFLPVYLDSLAFSATTIGVLVSLRAVASMAIRPFTSYTVRLLRGRYSAMSVSLLCMALGLIFTGFADSFYVLCLFSVLVGVGVGVSQPLSMVVIAESVPGSRRPHALATRLMANRAMQFLAPLLMGFIAQFSGFIMAYLACGVLILLHLTAFWLPARQSVHDEP